jgi:outer membrane protein assembly factor BamB
MTLELTRTRRGRLVARWLCLALALASALLVGACSPQDNSQNSVTVITPAPVDSTLTVFIEQASQLVAYHARDGATRWTYTPPERFDTADGLWYMFGLVLGFTYGSDHQTLVAVDAATGHLRWHVRVDGLEPPLIAFASDYVVLELRTQPSPPLLVIRVRDGAQVRGIPVPPWGDIAADGDTVFVCTYDAMLTAFGLPDGHPLWTVPVAPGLAEPGYPCGLRAGGGVVFAQVSFFKTGSQSPGGAVVALDARDGHRLWQKSSGLVLLNGGTGYSFVEQAPSAGQPPGTSLIAYRTADDTILWQIPTDTGSSPLAGDEHVLVFEHQMGGLRAVRASDGSFLWDYAHPSGRSLGPAAVMGGLVLAGSRTTTVYRFGPPPGIDVRDYLLVLGADNGQLYWKMALGVSDIAIGEAN